MFFIYAKLSSTLCLCINNIHIIGQDETGVQKKVSGGCTKKTEKNKNNESGDTTQRNSRGRFSSRTGNFRRSRSKPMRVYPLEGNIYNG